MLTYSNSVKRGTFLYVFFSSSSKCSDFSQDPNKSQIHWSVTSPQLWKGSSSQTKHSDLAASWYSISSFLHISRDWMWKRVKEWNCRLENSAESQVSVKFQFQVKCEPQGMLKNLRFTHDLVGWSSVEFSFSLGQAVSELRIFCGNTISDGRSIK